MRRTWLLVEHLSDRVGFLLALPRNFRDHRALEHVGEDESGVAMRRTDASGRVVDMADCDFPAFKVHVRQVVLEHRWACGLRRGSRRLRARDRRRELLKERDRRHRFSSCHHGGDYTIAQRVSHRRLPAFGSGLPGLSLLGSAFRKPESRKPKAESREPRAESRKPRAESRKPRTESRKPRAKSQRP